MNPIQPLKAVSARDKALDLSRMDVKEYIEKRDPNLVESLPGRTPIWHTLRPLTLVDLDMLATRPQALQARLAYELALVSVEGCDALAPSGAAWRPAREIEDADGGMRPAPSQSEMQRLFLAVGREAMLELGLVVIERADQGNGERGDTSYTVPPLLSDVVARSARPRAAPTPPTSATPT